MGIAFGLALAWLRGSAGGLADHQAGAENVADVADDARFQHLHQQRNRDPARLRARIRNAGWDRILRSQACYVPATRLRLG